MSAYNHNAVYFKAKEQLLEQLTFLTRHILNSLGVIELRNRGVVLAQSNGNGLEPCDANYLLDTLTIVRNIMSLKIDIYSAGISGELDRDHDLFLEAYNEIFDLYEPYINDILEFLKPAFMGHRDKRSLFIKVANFNYPLSDDEIDMFHRFTHTRIFDQDPNEELMFVKIPSTQEVLKYCSNYDITNAQRAELVELVSNFDMACARAFGLLYQFRRKEGHIDKHSFYNLTLLSPSISFRKISSILLNQPDRDLRTPLLNAGIFNSMRIITQATEEIVEDIITSSDYEFSPYIDDLGESLQDIIERCEGYTIEYELDQNSIITFD